MNNDDMFLAVAMENGLLSKEDLYNLGISDWDYFNMNEEVINKLDEYFKSKKK